MPGPYRLAGAGTRRQSAPTTRMRRVGRWLADDRRRQCLGADWHRRGARPDIWPAATSPSPDFYGGLRPGDNRRADFVVALKAETGAVALELPACAPRSVGLRHPRPAELRYDHPRRQGARRRRSGHQAGAGLRARPRHRPARPADRGAPGSAGRCRGRGAVADPALPDRPAAARPRTASRPNRLGG